MTLAFDTWLRQSMRQGTTPENASPDRCPDCGSRTCARDDSCVAHEDEVPYEDSDQRLGGWDNPYEGD